MSKRSVAGSTEPALTLALPKGRLQEQTQEHLERAGFSLEFEKRKLVATDQSGRLKVMLVKNSDLPTYVHHGIAGLGVCGTDVIYESGYDFFELLEMPFGATRMCLAAHKDFDPEAGISSGTVKIASKFTRFARDYFSERGIAAEIIRLGGSVELAPVLGLAPYIVDLVETGSTLRAHDLEIIEELVKIRVVLVANSAYYKFHYRSIEALVDTLREGAHG
ncbi:MAG: ATP phosphoribosyltransferase [Spirochaetales bacterium]